MRFDVGCGLYTTNLLSRFIPWPQQYTIDNEIWNNFLFNFLNLTDGRPPYNMANAVLLEARSYRPFKSSEEYLYAMREDLAEWLNMLYPELHINTNNFMDRLDTGVALCKVSYYLIHSFWLTLWPIQMIVKWFYVAISWYGGLVVQVHERYSGHHFIIWTSDLPLTHLCHLWRHQDRRSSKGSLIAMNAMNDQYRWYTTMYTPAIPHRFVGISEFPVVESTQNRKW